MKKAGVPLTPTFWPAAWSPAPLRPSRRSPGTRRTCALSRPSSVAYFLSRRTSSACWLAKSLSCISQNLPWSLAHARPRRPCGACLWKPAGTGGTPGAPCRRRPSSPRPRAVARLQNGHWKSLNSTMVTGAFSGPLAGPVAATCLRSAGAGRLGQLVICTLAPLLSSSKNSARALLLLAAGEEVDDLRLHLLMVAPGGSWPWPRRTSS